MKNHFYLAWCAVAVGLVAVSASHMQGQQPSKNERSRAQAGNQNDDSDAQLEAQSVEQRSAALALELARLDVQEAQSANQRAPGTIAATDIQRLQEVVKVAEQQLNKTQGGPGVSPQMREAVANARLAQSEFAKAMRANSQARDAVTPGNLKRLRLRAELARVNLARLRASGDVQNIVAEMQTQLDQLRDEVAELRQRLDGLQGSAADNPASQSPGK